MALNLEQKKVIVTEVADIASSAHSAVVANYRGLTVGQMTELRVKARDAKVYLRVVRNTLARRAVEGTEFECLRDAFTGPVVIAFSQDDPGASARIIKEFAKTNESLKVEALAIGGNLLSANDIDVVAKLPTKEEALGKLVSVIQAPIAKFVRTVAEPKAKFVRTLMAVKEKKAAEAA